MSREIHVLQFIRSPSPSSDISKLVCLKIYRIWRNHVIQVWTKSYSAICRASSCFEQQVAIFFPVKSASELFFKCLTFSEKTSRRMLSLFESPSGEPTFQVGRKLKNSQDTENPDASLDNRLSWFYVKLLGCLFTRLNYTSC